jgi:hypothetical protein
MDSDVMEGHGQAQAQDIPASSTDFVFYHSEGDDEPIGQPPVTTKESGSAGGRDAAETAESGKSRIPSFIFPITDHPLAVGVGRIQRARRGGRMAEALQHEKADEHGNPIKRLTGTATTRPLRKARQVKKQRVDVVTSDEDDHDYQNNTEPAESESASPSESDSVLLLPSNAEVSYHICRLISF